MSTTNDQTLLQAYELIENNQHDAAANLLQPLLMSGDAGADAWWIYAHAVTDRDKARDALINVIEADPNYPGASDLLEHFETSLPDTSTQSLPTVSPIKPLPSTSDDDFPSDVDFGDGDAESEFDFGESEDPDFDRTFLDDEPTQKPRRNRLLPVLLILIIIVLVVAGLLVLNPFGGQSQEEVVATALSAFSLPENPISTQSTALGETSLVAVCNPADSSVRSSLLSTMSSVVEQTPTLATEGVEAVGVRVLNCDTGEVLRAIGVPVEDATAFLEGTLEESAFQARWQVLDLR